MPTLRSNTIPDRDDVSAALRLLAESLEEEEKRIRSEGSKAMNEGDYDTATAVIDFAKRLLAFQKKVAGLEKEWDDLEDLRDRASPAVQEIVSKRFFGRQRKGDITSQEDYCRPLLQALVEMGGKGKTAAVIARVGEILKPVLKPKDYEKTATRAKATRSRELRWQNATNWARDAMVKDGRLKSDSPHGIWEISARGRESLKARTAD